MKCFFPVTEPISWSCCNQCPCFYYPARLFSLCQLHKLKTLIPITTWSVDLIEFFDLLVKVRVLLCNQNNITCSSDSFQRHWCIQLKQNMTALISYTSRKGNYILKWTKPDDGPIHCTLVNKVLDCQEIKYRRAHPLVQLHFK